MNGISNSIQFADKDCVFKAFQDRDVPAWSITQGKQFMFKGYGAEDLLPVLEMLEQGSTNAIYTLRVYEDFDSKGKIKSNTPDDGSFNFKLNAPGQLITNNQYSQMDGRNSIMEELKAIRLRLDAIDEEEEEKPNSNMGMIGTILEHPVLSPIIPVIIQNVMSAIFGNKNLPVPQLQPAQIGNADPGELHLSLEQVVNELGKHDPDLRKHLEKLLQIAINQPAVFSSVIKSLD